MTTRASFLPIALPPAASSGERRPALFSIPVVEPVTLRHPACDIDDHCLALPTFDKLFPAKHAQQELFHEFGAPVLEQLHALLHPAIERHGNLPGPRKGFRVFDRGFVTDDVRRHQRETLHDVQRLTVEVPGPVEPRLVVEMPRIHHECVALPSSEGVAHPCVVRWVVDCIQMNRAGRGAERIRHVNLVRAVCDLDRIGHVHPARRSWQITLQLRTAIDPVCGILLFDLQRFGRVWDPAIALYHPNRSRYATGSPERQRGCRGHLRVLVRVDSRLRHCAWAGLVSLEIPVRFVVGLPDAAEIWFADDTSWHFHLAGRSCDPQRKDCAGSGRGDCYPNQRRFRSASHTTCFSLCTGCGPATYFK